MHLRRRKNKEFAFNFNDACLQLINNATYAHDKPNFFHGLC